jgi:hypothetical protein
MADALKHSDIVALYRDTFGKDPEFTGGRMWSPGEICAALLDAIDSGEPFVDEPVTPGVII